MKYGAVGRIYDCRYLQLVEHGLSPHTAHKNIIKLFNLHMATFQYD